MMEDRIRFQDIHLYILVYQIEVGYVMQTSALYGKYKEVGVISYC